MKKFFNLSIMAILLSATIIIATSCSDDDKDELNPPNSIRFAELPNTAQLFVHNHFDEGDVDLVLRNTSEGTEGYNVSVKGYKIDFDKDGSWEKIEAKDNGALPANITALIPIQVMGYIEHNYPGRGINEIKKKDYGYKVELAGNTDVELYPNITITFDKDGSLWGVTEDENNNNNQSKMTFESLPQPVKDFVSKHFPNINVLYVNKTYKEYKIGLTDGTRMDFTMDNQIQAIVSVRGEGIPSGAVLPTIADYVGKNYPNKKMTVYVRQFNGFIIELSGYPVRKMFFDLNGNFIRAYN